MYVVFVWQSARFVRLTDFSLFRWLKYCILYKLVVYICVCVDCILLQMYIFLYLMTRDGEFILNVHTHTTHVQKNNDRALSF